ncbi:DUF1295 domain-containing protein [Ornithinimicrobium panacihumi]|uniref:DUF1295 domain-containing protein n=1 Tax=Ornithinimicrobium panacihumi TaxID=2008449 RepID=UPI003F8BD80C
MAAAPSARRFALVPLVVILGVALASAGSQGGQRPGGVPLFALAVALAFLIQWIAFLPAWKLQTERHFDLTGSLTYIAVTIFLLAAVPERGARTYLLAAMVVVWAVRLGSFLFTRISRSGGDGRFDEIKPDTVRFLGVWTIQGLWVSLTAAAAWIAMTSDRAGGIDVWAIVGLAMWLVGFTVEVVADLQKSTFNREHKGEFISVGLWSRSRHPNYFGEILLWVGVLVVALPALSGWQYVALLSPVFVTLLLARVSGVPLLEKRAQEKWGEDPAYQSYVSRTPVLVPRLTQPRPE